MKEKANKPVLKARHSSLVSTKVGEETVIFDRQRNTALCLNKVSSIVWEYCDGLNDISKVIDVLRKNGIHDADAQVVMAATEQLCEFNLLENPINGESPNTHGFRRREALRQLKMYSVAALPVITALNIAPAMAQVSGSLPNNSPCGSSAECASGCCRQVGGVFVCKSGGGGCI
jgi:hypothetical protein